MWLSYLCWCERDSIFLGFEELVGAPVLGHERLDVQRGPWYGSVLVGLRRRIERDPERRHELLGVGKLFVHLDVMCGETVTQVVEAEKRVVEIETPALVGRSHFGVVRSPGIAVAQQDVVDKVGHDALGVHQLPDGLQHRLEVVLLGLATHQNVESLVDIIAPRRGSLHVCVVLVAVQRHSVGPIVPCQLRFGLRALLDHTAIVVQHSFHLTPADVNQASLVDKVLL